MAFTIPHTSDAIEDPADTFPQAQWDRKDIEVMVAAFQNVGVLTGCAVTAQGTPAMSVHVAAGTVMVGGTTTTDIVSVSAGDVTITAAHASLRRFDLVVVSNAGALSVVAGTPAAAPVFPSIPASRAVLAAVYVPAADTAVETAQIVDKRMILSSPPAPSAATWTTVSKASDTTRSNTTTFASDPDLTFSMLANTAYRIRGTIRWTALASSDIKFQFTGPASPTQFLLRFSLFNQVTALEVTGTTFDTAYSTSHAIASTSDNDNITKFEGVIKNGVNAGTFAVQWAQNSAVVENTVVRAASYIEYGVA